MQQKRKIKGKTDYRKRLKLLLFDKPRLVIRKSLTQITAQIIDYSPKGDNTLLSATSRELKKFGWQIGLKNTPAAYLTGLLLGKKAFEKNIREVTPDIGFAAPKKGAVIFALLKGAKDAGLKFSLDNSILPHESRIKGEHIKNYLKQNPNVFKTYKINPEELLKNFEDTKDKINKK